MKSQYDFSTGKRGPATKVPPGKTRITIRLDNDILEWFRSRVHAAGGGNYQTMINDALREYIHQDLEFLEDTLRRVVREELSRKAS
ncbi:BrnA antitoxin family protein [Gemmatimonadota bacterium]